MVASHTAAPFGAAKWLVRATPTPKTLPLGKGHTQNMSPTQGQADIIGGNPIPAISKHPRAFLYGWLPLSDAAGILIANGPSASSLQIAPCLLPNGILLFMVIIKYHGGGLIYNAIVHPNIIPNDFSL